MAAKKAKKSGVDWAAPFFTVKQTETFEKMVEAELQKRGLRFELGRGVVHVERENGKVPCGLTNLAQDCQHLAQSKWKKRIAFHFDALFSTLDEEAELDRRAKHFDDVAALLRVRLHSQDWLDGVDPKQTVYVQVANSLFAALVFDLPKAVVGVTPSQVKAWKKKTATLIELGIDNVEREGLLPVTDVELDDGLTAIGLDTESFFTATHAFFHERYLDAKPRKGTLVAAPTRHTAIFHPVSGKKSESAVRPMLEMASGFYQRGPGQASPFLYHVVDGVFSIIEMEFTKRDVKLHYPKSLAQAFR